VKGRDLRDCPSHSFQAKLQAFQDERHEWEMGRGPTNLLGHLWAFRY
jgi:hypothetical protein